MVEELRATGLTRRFGGTAVVADVSFTLAPGEVLGILGPSGAGKSTLLRMINHLVAPEAGAVHYGGLDVSALHGRALRLWGARAAMIFQQFNLVGRLDVLTNVLIGLLARRPLVAALAMHFTAEERARAMLALDRLGLAEHALQRAETLSGGQQQRVAVARALMQDPEIILADEPVASLDPANAELVLGDLRRINRERGTSLLLALHDVRAARENCDRVLALRAGRCVFCGTVAELTDDRVQAIYQGLHARGSSLEVA